MEGVIQKAKKQNASRIPYFVTACGKGAKDPRGEGKFMLSFWPSTKVRIRHEYITATPRGFRYRQEIHPTTGKNRSRLSLQYVTILFSAALFKFFKENYNSPPPPPRKSQLANLMKNLNVQQLAELKSKKDDRVDDDDMGGHYTPSDPMMDAAHTPSELPYQARNKAVMSRVTNDKDHFKRPNDRNRGDGGWGGASPAPGRGGGGGYNNRGGDNNDRGGGRFGDGRRGPDRSPEPRGGGDNNRGNRFESRRTHTFFSIELGAI